MYDTLAPLLADNPWAITRAVLDGLIATRLDSISPLGARESPPRAARGGVAVIPIRGAISQHAGGGLFEVLFGGGANTDQISKDFREAMADDSVRGVVFDIDSPGGSAFGVSELANEIYKARGRKPIVAVANSLAASAAYWIGAAADEIYTTPTGVTGSIGAFVTHLDMSAAAEREGVKPTIISAGKYKVEGNEFAPLDEDARAAAQRFVDSYYDLFVHDVARFRGATDAAVRNGYGEGRALTSKDALKAGLVDGIRTYDQVLARIGTEQRATTALTEVAAESHTPFLEHLEAAATADFELATRLKRRSDFRAGEGRTLGDTTVTAVQSWLSARSALTHEVEQLLVSQPDPGRDAWAEFQLQLLREAAAEMRAPEMAHT